MPGEIKPEISTACRKYGSVNRKDTTVLQSQHRVAQQIILSEIV